MQKTEDLPNNGESIVSISGSEKGVWVMVAGKRENILRILKDAIRTNSKLGEIFRELSLNESGQDKKQDQMRQEFPVS